MRNVTLFEGNEHRFVLLSESDPGEEDGTRSNQHLILHGNSGVLLDRGGFGVMPRMLALTSASVYVSSIWMRFLPHFGIKEMNRFESIPDEAMHCRIEEDFELDLIPAHFLHSEGGFFHTEAS